jgi:hypothetical protein
LISNWEDRYNAGFVWAAENTDIKNEARIMRGAERDSLGRRERGFSLL